MNNNARDSRIIIVSVILQYFISSSSISKWKEQNIFGQCTYSNLREQTLSQETTCLDQMPYTIPFGP